ncbi:hypothetical protein VN0785_09830 [Helicobacter pylori]
MPVIVKENVKGLVNKQALTKEKHNELLSQFDKQAPINALKQEIKNEIKSELDNLLSGSEFLQNALMLKADILNNKIDEDRNQVRLQFEAKELIEEGS